MSFLKQLAHQKLCPIPIDTPALLPPSLTTSLQTFTSHLPLPSIVIKGFTCFHHCVYLIQTKVSVSLCDSLAEAVRERVQHAVVWMH